MGRVSTIIFLLVVGSSLHAAECVELAKEYVRYDGDRVRFELSGIQDSSMPREQTRLASIMIILQRQAIVLDLMIAHGCDLPDPPQEFSHRGLLCQGSPQACR